MAYKHITYEMAHGIAEHLLQGRMTRTQVCSEYGVSMGELPMVWRKYGLKEKVRSTKLSSRSGRKIFTEGGGQEPAEAGIEFPR